MKYTSNVTKVIDDVVVLSIQNKNLLDSTCGLY